MLQGQRESQQAWSWCRWRRAVGRDGEVVSGGRAHGGEDGGQEINFYSDHNGKHWKILSRKECMYCVCAQSLQSCPTRCDPMDCSPLASSVQGILQARILEWFAISFSRDLPKPRIEPATLASHALAGRFFTTCATWEAQKRHGLAFPPLKIRRVRLG